MIRFQMYLADDEQAALQRMAETDLRGVREEIRIILRHELERRGLLEKSPESCDRNTIQGVKDASH